jgi:tetratricopeptide (TPR) repeat protein
MDTNSRLAIEASLAHDWKRAIELNKQLLKDNPKDTDSLNRLARAYFETGLKTKSQEMYLKVLRIDKFNPIAAKNLELLKSSTISRSHKSPPCLTPTPEFLEEPGSTKNVILTRLGNPKIVSRLHPGDAVSIVAHEHCVSAISDAQDYLGRLPDDLASHMRAFLKAGNVYQAWIKSNESKSGKQTLKIFIKEVSRAPKFAHTPSFPATEKLSYAAFTPPELVHEQKPDTSITGEDSGESFSPAEALEDSGDAPEPLPDED